MRFVLQRVKHASVKVDGELGAVDVGGGGTVALFVAGMDVDVVDMGVPILSMHAPFELASKLDIYNTYLAFAAFCS